MTSTILLYAPIAKQLINIPKIDDACKIFFDNILFMADGDLCM